MLVGLRLWHVASKRHPERESRLLRMTTTPGANPPNTPQGAPNAQNQPANPNAAQNTANATRGQAITILRASGGEFHKSVDKTVNDLHASSQKLHSMLDQAPDIEPLINQLPADLQREWRTCLLDAQMMQTSLTTAERDLRQLNGTITSWANLELPPGQLLSTLEGIWPAGGTPDQQQAHDAIVGGLRTYLQTKSQELAQSLGTPIDLVADGRPWMGGTINESQKIEIQNEINALLERAKADSLLVQANGLGEHLVQLSNGRVDIQQMDAFIKELRKQEAEQKALEETGVIQGGSGWKFYSIMDIYEGAKSVVESYKRTWSQHRQLASANVAKSLGKFVSWLPYGDEVQQVLDSELKGKNDEVKDKYLNYLKTQNMSFPQIFGDHGELFRIKNDPNLSRAVLEYAASRGWLYNINEIDVGGKILGMFKLQSLATDYQQNELDNYFQKLRDDNTEGGKKEKDRIKARENKDSFDDFLKALKVQFKERNLWGATGVMERAIERGLSDVVVTRMAVEFMRQLRDDPEVAYYFSGNRDLIDQIGALSMYNSAFTLGWFKGDRRTIQKWLKERRSNPHADMNEASKLFQVAGTIEQSVRQRLGEAAFARLQQGDKSGLDDIVGKVLTGQLVYTDANGKILESQKGAAAAFSLFEEEHRFYRDDKFITVHHNVTKPFDEDTDYFTEDTEQILQNGSDIKTILQFTSTRAMQDESRATALLNKFLKQEAKLRETQHLGPAVHAQFLARSRSTLTDFWKNYLNDTALSKTYPTLLSSSPRPRPLFAELIARKQIDIDIFLQEPKAPCSKEFIRQLYESNDFGPQTLQQEFGWSARDVQLLEEGFNNSNA